MEHKIIKILIVEDHLIARLGIVAILNSQPDLVVVAEAASGGEALKLFRQHQPDVTLMDLGLPDASGETVIADLKAEFPAAQIIALTVVDGDGAIKRAMHAGAKGYLLKGVEAAELIKAIRIVSAGKRYLPLEVQTRLFEYPPDDDLTARELEVLELLLKGKSNREIGDHLFIAEQTVKNHLKNIFGKLQVTDRTEAAVVALQRNLIKQS